MTSQNTNLDVSQKIINDDGTPTSYFEDWCYSLVSTVGGESGDLINDLVDSQKVAAFGNLLSNLEKELGYLESTQQNRVDLSPLISAINDLRSDLNDALSQIQLRQDLSSIIKRIETLEVQI